MLRQTEMARSRPVTPRDSRKATASVALVLVLVTGLLTYKGASALGRIREVRVSGSMTLDPHAVLGRGDVSARDVMARSMRYLLLVAPALMFGILVGGAVRAFVSPTWLARAFHRPGFRDHIVAGLAGAPLMLCSCCVAPVFSTVYERTARVGPSLALALAAPSLNPAAIGLTFLLFRPSIAVARLLMAVVAVFALPLIVGSAWGPRCRPSEPNPGPLSSSARRGLITEFLRASGHVAVQGVPVIVAGVVLSLWFAQRFPLDTLSSRPFGAAGLVVFASLLAVPVVLPTFFEIPVAATLLATGAPAGVAAAVLFAGPAINLASLLTVAKETRWTVALVVGVFVAAIAMIGGLSIR